MATVSMSGGSKAVTVEIENYAEIQEYFRKAPYVVAKHVDEAFSKATIEAQAKIRLEAPADRNRLRNSILIRKMGELSYAVGTNTKYALYVEGGTRPHRAPWKPIEAWAKRRGIPAFPVWYKIMKEGTKPNPFFERGVENAESSINRFFKTAERKIVAELGG